MILLRCLALLLVMTGCAPQPPTPVPHYVLGGPYQANGIWYYPRETFDYDETGLAAVIPANASHAMAALSLFTGTPARLTTDGEAFDQTALAAAHPTLQLPAIARITNLENGRQVLVRINDRGPAAPDRLLQITSRTADLLQAANPQAIRVRVQLLEAESRRAIAGLQTEGQPMKIAAAPAGSVHAEALAPPPGAAQATVAAPVAALPHPAGPNDQAPATIPLRLPEAITLVPVQPTTLAIDCGDFSELLYATLLQSRLTRLGARVSTDYNAPRDRAFMVRIGPLPDVPAAEAMRRRATAAGATDARIVVE